MKLKSPNGWFALGTVSVACNAELYYCPSMAQYKFLHRTVEVMSPLWNEKSRFG